MYISLFSHHIKSGGQPPMTAPRAKRPPSDATTYASIDHRKYNTNYPEGTYSAQTVKKQKEIIYADPKNLQLGTKEKPLPPTPAPGKKLTLQNAFKQVQTGLKSIKSATVAIGSSLKNSLKQAQTALRAKKTGEPIYSQVKKTANINITPPPIPQRNYQKPLNTQPTYSTAINPNTPPPIPPKPLAAPKGTTYDPKTYSPNTRPKDFMNIQEAQQILRAKNTRPTVPQKPTDRNIDPITGASIFDTVNRPDLAPKVPPRSETLTEIAPPVPSRRSKHQLVLSSQS